MRRLLLALALLGCDGATVADGGLAIDGGPEVVDAGRADGGVDAGGATGDAGVDAGASDDAGRDDAGAPDAGPSGPLQLYVAPDGDDTRDGLSEATAVLSLGRVHELLEALRPERDVEVRIAPGTYHGQTVSWRYHHPEREIRFMPLGDERDRPVFDGCLADGSCPGGTWLRLRVSSGARTNLHFRYLRVQRYQTAISLDGNRNDPAASNGGNTIFGCYFDRIGNVFAPSLDPSTAAVRLVNSDDNRIENNHFVDVVNTRSGGLIHALYVAHLSDRNTIARNRFLRSTGDPVRLRDYSNDNVITDNRFIRVGTHAGYTDWYCDHDARTDCTKPTPECPSWNNQFRDNLLDGDWTCGALGTFHYFQDDATTGCSPPSAGARRLRTSGNESTAAPCSME